MGDNYTGGDDHLSHWFVTNQNHQQQQTHLQLQYHAQPQQMAQAPVDNDRNEYRGEEAPPTAIDRAQHQTYYSRTQYSDQPQQQQPLPAQQTEQQPYPQAYQQQSIYPQDVPPRHYTQHQQSYSDQQQRRQEESQGLNIDLDSNVVNSPTRRAGNVYQPSSFNNYDAYPSQAHTSMEPPPMRPPHSQRIGNIKSLQRTLSGASTGSNVSGNQSQNSISDSRSKARSERKRTREKQRRDGVNRQFAELTKVLKRLELEEREEAERKARIAAGSEGSMSTSLHSVRLPFIAPNNSVDLIACAIVHLQHLHRMSKRQQEDLNRLEDELQNAKKAGEDTATKLKEVLFNYQIPRPHLGLANPNFNVGNSSSNNDVCNAGMNNSNNSSSSLSNNTDTIMNGAMRNNNGNTTASTPMMAMMAGGQQKEQQVMMIVPMMVNAKGQAMIIGQTQECNMSGIVMQHITQGTATTSSSIGSTSSSNIIFQKPSSQQQPNSTDLPVQQYIPYQIASQEPVKSSPSNSTTQHHHQQRQQKLAVQLQHQYLQRQSQPMPYSTSNATSQGSSAPVQQQKQIVIEQQHSNNSAKIVANVNSEASSAAEHSLTETGKQPQVSPTSGVFAVALAAALSNLRSGKGDSQDQQHEQPIHTPPPSELLHNASTFDHAAALGTAIAASPVVDTVAQTSNPTNSTAAVTTLADSNNTDNPISTVTHTEASSATQGKPGVNSGNAC